MVLTKIELLPKSQVKLIDGTGKEDIRTARGILMKPWGVKASLEGKKTQTRRIIQPQPYQNEYEPEMLHVWEKGISRTVTKNYFLNKCKQGKPGDLFYIRECFFIIGDPYEADQGAFEPTGEYLYLEDEEKARVAPHIKKPGIHMPREAARYWFEIIDIRVERIQDISHEDAKAEGIENEDNKRLIHYHCDYSIPDGHRCNYRIAFENKWNDINEKRGFGWDVNPWVWVIEYKKIFEGIGK